MLLFLKSTIFNYLNNITYFNIYVYEFVFYIKVESHLHTCK